MIGSKKPLTPLGKFLATKAIALDLSRSELAARIGVSENLLHKLMHGNGFKMQSVNRVLAVFAEDITEEMAETFKLGAKGQMSRFVFEAVPGSVEETYLEAIQAMLPMIPELGEHFFDAAKAHMKEHITLLEEEEEEEFNIESDVIENGAVETATIPRDQVVRPADDETAL